MGTNTTHTHPPPPPPGARLQSRLSCEKQPLAPTGGIAPDLHLQLKLRLLLLQLLQLRLLKL
eukprot:scaffold323809_cov18-Tisochrysis_lutea.AAC.1